MKSSSPGAAIAGRPANVGAPPEIPRNGWAERTTPIRVVIASDHLGYADGVIHGPARWFRNVLPLFDPARVHGQLLILGKDHPFEAELRRAGKSSEGRRHFGG